MAHMKMAPAMVLTEETPAADTILSAITDLHASCILHNHTLATFLPPLSQQIMQQWWRERVCEVTAGQRHIIVQLLPVSSRTSNVQHPFPDRAPQVISTTNTNGEIEQMEVAGVVTLSKPAGQTGPFRAVVEKLFVSPNHRRRGIARGVMAKLEELAKQDGKWNLMLDTTVGTAAEMVYPALGYIRLGVVPEYGISPEDGRLVDEVWFWKDLRKSAPL